MWFPAVEHLSQYLRVSGLFDEVENAISKGNLAVEDRPLEDCRSYVHICKPLEVGQSLPDCWLLVLQGLSSGQHFSKEQSIFSKYAHGLHK